MASTSFSCVASIEDTVISNAFNWDNRSRAKDSSCNSFSVVLRFTSD
jgi:hypothetical protein